MSGLQQELRKNRPFSSLEQEVFLNIQRTADVLMGEVAELLKPFGLSPTQYNVLRILRGAGADGLACREVGERMVTRDPDVTRLLDRMEARELITRHRQTDDRRVIKARITAAGLELLKKLDRPVEELHLRQLGRLGNARLKELSANLELARERPK